MALLFSYGTLRDELVQRSLFGRTLTGWVDTLLGYELLQAAVADPEFVRTSGKRYHAILRRARDHTARVEGMVFEVTTAELALADGYEPPGYRRVQAPLSSGRDCWVYVDAADGRGET